MAAHIFDTRADGSRAFARSYCAPGESRSLLQLLGLRRGHWCRRWLCVSRLSHVGSLRRGLRGGLRLLDPVRLLVVATAGSGLRPRLCRIRGRGFSLGLVVTMRLFVVAPLREGGARESQRGKQYYDSSKIAFHC